MNIKNLWLINRGSKIISENKEEIYRKDNITKLINTQCIINSKIKPHCAYSFGCTKGFDVCK